MPQPSVIANLDDVASFAASLPDDYLRCRIIKRHVIDESRSRVTYSRKHRTFDENGPCMICGQPVHILYAESGEVLHQTIDYDRERYLMPRGSGRVDKRGQDIFRAERLRRRRQPLRAVKVG